MSTDNRHNTRYSAADIEKYRKGELSAREMHDLEQAALDDPFLADAIEGFMQHPHPTQDLSDLHDRLNKRITDGNRRATVMPIHRRATFAAAVIVLLGVGYIFFYHRANQPSRSRQSALTAQPSAQPTQPAAAGPASSSAAHAATTRPPATGASPPAVASATRSDIVRSTITRRHRAPVGYKAATTQTADTTNPDKIARESLFRSQAGNAATIPATDRYVNFAAAGPRVYTGKVLDLQNHPLAGAYLALSGKPASGTTTDDQGQFMIRLHPPDTTRQLTVSLIGYDHASLAVNDLNFQNQASNVIRLRPSNANLDEVIVAGYGMHRKATEAAAPSASNERLDTLWIRAAPVIGRQAYLQYLNLSKNKLGLDSTITGTETVSFIVSSDGSLSSFKIEQSLSPAHDNTLIRLVMDGPAWRPLRGKKVRAAVTMNF